MEVGTLKFAWKIKNFSKINAGMVSSDVFFLGPYKWMIDAYPKSYIVKEHMSIFLRIVDSETMPSDWSLKARSSFTLVDQINNKSSITESDGKVHEFNAKNCFDCRSFFSHKELYDLNKGYLVEDTCIIKTDVTLYGDDYLESRAASKENEDDLAKNATEEDIDSFFGDLNSVVFPKKVTSMKEEAKEALATIEETLSMVPIDVNNPGRISQLVNAFDILSSLDDCSSRVMEQKAELVSMKYSFIGLPERATKASKNIKLFVEKELVKKTLDNKLGRCLIEFEKTKSETTKADQSIVTLQERVDSFLTQIGETKKKRENLLSKQKEMFKVSRELKGELDVLVKNWSEYEAKMKVAEEEEKVVSMEWDKMKKLVSSLKTLL